MDNKNNIIGVLISQHNDLRKIMTEAGEMAYDSATAEDIHKKIAEFKELLYIHLDLENNTFYPELLKKLEGEGFDTNDTKKFIKEMKNIESAVSGFLERYSSPEKIEALSNEFSSDFKRISATLLMRLEAEEGGVYLYW